MICLRRDLTIIVCDDEYVFFAMRDFDATVWLCTATIKE